MTDKLKPCPFCGGEAEVIGHYIKGVANNYQYFVRCKSCKARPRSCNTFKKKEKAIEYWNTRKPIDRIVEQLEEKIEENPYCSLADYRAGLFEAIEIVKGVQNE